METIKTKIRKVFILLQNNKEDFVILSGKKYRIGKMSYDEWFLEPYNKNHKETDDFVKNTLWEKDDTADILQLFEDNNLIVLKVV